MEWGDAQEAAFKKLQSLITTPILTVANPAKPYTPQTDASDRGVGAVLSQTDEEDDEHPVAYASRKLLPCEVNYSTIEKGSCSLVKLTIPLLRKSALQLCGHSSSSTLTSMAKPLSSRQIIDNWLGCIK